MVEARAVRIADSPWAPLFTAAVEPNSFTAIVEAEKQDHNLGSNKEFLDSCSSPEIGSAARHLLDGWTVAGHRHRRGPDHIVLMARGPSRNGWRTVIAAFTDGRVLVPFGSYGGQNSGIPIESLTTLDFRTGTDQFFGFNGSEKQARTPVGWLDVMRAEPLLSFALRVAAAYQSALNAETSSASPTGPMGLLSAPDGVAHLG